TRDDVGKDAQLDIAMLRDRGEQVAIDAARPGDRLAVVKGARGRGEPPYLLGDAVHVNGEADAAIANQGEAQFLFPHDQRDSGVWWAASPLAVDLRGFGVGSCHS